MLLISGRFSYVFSSFSRYSNSDYCDRRSHSCIHLHLNCRSCGYLFCQRNAFRKTESQVSSHQVRTNTTYTDAVGEKLLFILNNWARIQFWNRIMFWKHLRINHSPKILVLVVVVNKVLWYILVNYNGSHKYVLMRHALDIEQRLLARNTFKLLVFWSLLTLLPSRPLPSPPLPSLPPFRVKRKQEWMYSSRQTKSARRLNLSTFMED